MSADNIYHYVVTVRYQATGLRPVTNLTGALTQANFTPTLTDSQGVVHELGPHTFGLTTPLSQEKAEDLTRGLAQAALHEDPQITITTFEAWLTNISDSI